MEYRIIRSNRKTIAIEITPRGKVIVRCPLRMASRDIQKFLSAKAAWIRTHLANLPKVTPLSEEEHRALIRSAKDFFPERVRSFAEKMDVTFGRITIRSQHSRWGSCSASGNLNFNCLLMLAPEAVRDYVIVHELCHRKVMNHSPRFWQEVSAVLPDFQAHRRWLKENGASLLARLPAKEDAQR